LSNGVYQIRVNTAEASYSQRVVLQRWGGVWAVLIQAKWSEVMVRIEQIFKSI
jgi:hypothetical protein